MQEPNEAEPELKHKDNKNIVVSFSHSATPPAAHQDVDLFPFLYELLPQCGVARSCFRLTRGMIQTSVFLNIPQLSPSFVVTVPTFLERVAGIKFKMSECLPKSIKFAKFPSRLLLWT